MNCDNNCGSCRYQLDPTHCADVVSGAVADGENELDGLRAENARLRRECIEQEAASLELAGDLGRVQKKLDGARAELAAWVGWSDHHTAWKFLASERPPPEEIRSELGSYLDDREQHLATLADLGQQLEATSQSRDRALVRCREASEVLIAEIGAAGPENVEETARRAVEHLRTIQDKRERALVELARNGCDCECECDSEGHGDDCEPCLACRIGAILEDRP